MDLLQLFLGQIPEAIYFALFMIFAKQLKEKRVLFIILMVAEYLLLVHVLIFNSWFQIIYTFLTFLTLKVLYKEKCQIIDVFTFGIASLILILISILSFIVCKGNMIAGSIINRILLIFFFIFLYEKLHYIEVLYKKCWNRNDKNKNKMKSATFRSMNVVIFNIMFYFINLGMVYAIYYNSL